MDSDLQFIFEKFKTATDFLDIHSKVTDNIWKFDIYHKPANSFSYLNYSSCHPTHTGNKIPFIGLKCCSYSKRDKK